MCWVIVGVHARKQHVVSEGGASSQHGSGTLRVFRAMPTETKVEIEEGGVVGRC